MKRGVALTAIGLGLALGCSLGGVPAARGQEAAVEERLESLEQQLVGQRGQRLYDQACAPCHGVRGDGQGPGARGLDPKPRDFTQGLFKFRTTPSGAVPTDADLFRIVSEGVPGTSMPAWERLLSARQRHALVQYIKTFAVKDVDGRRIDLFEIRKAPPVAIPAGPPTATVETLAQGRKVYEKLECATCHGESGRGDGPSALEQKDDWGMPITPTDFGEGHFRGGGAVADIYLRITTGLNGTPMPAWEDLATQEERWSLAHYVRSLARPKNLWHYLFVDTGEFFPGR